MAVRVDSIMRRTNSCDNDDSVGFDQYATRDLKRYLKGLSACAIDCIAQSDHFEATVVNE